MLLRLLHHAIRVLRWTVLAVALGATFMRPCDNPLPSAQLAHAAPASPPSSNVCRLEVATCACRICYPCFFFLMYVDEQSRVAKYLVSNLHAIEHRSSDTLCRVGPKSMAFAFSHCCMSAQVETCLVCGTDTPWHGGAPTNFRCHKKNQYELRDHVDTATMATKWQESLRELTPQKLLSCKSASTLSVSKYRWQHLGTPTLLRSPTLGTSSWNPLITPQ